MKRLSVIAVICFLAVGLCGCGAETAEWSQAAKPPIPEVSAALIPPAAPTPLPENVVRETFRPVEYLDPLTVTVTYGENGQNRVEIVQDGTVIQTILEDDREWNSAWRQLTVEDVNFDGYLDFHFCYATFAGPNYWEHIYLYEYDYLEGKSSFRKVEELDGMCQLAFDQAAKTVCERESGMGPAVDTLYKWTEEGIAARRRLSREFDNSSQRTIFTVWERVPGAPVIPEWDEPEGYWVQIFRQELKGEVGYSTALAQWYDVDYYGESREPPEEIPEDLLDFLTPLVAENTWRPFAKQYAAGRAVSHEEAEEIWERASGSPAKDINFFVWGSRLDGDNDGRQDLFVCDTQGTGHFNQFYFLKDGGEATEAGLLGTSTEDYFITWKGARYLLTPWHDDDTLRFEGLNVWLFRDGVGARRAWLERRVTGYETLERWAAEGYSEVLEDLKGRVERLWREFDESWEQPQGTAERRMEGEESFHYLCDLNNDGTEERYEKCTIGARRYLTMELEDGSMPLKDLDIQKESPLQFCWVDAWPQGNLLYTADCQGDGPIRFTVWRWEGEKTEMAAFLILEQKHGAGLAYYGADCGFDWW